MQRYKYTHIPNWLQKWNSVYGNICILFQTPCIGNRHQLYRQWIPENSDFILLDGNRFSFNVVWARSCAECLFQNQRLKIRRICILLPILNAKVRIRCLNIRYTIWFFHSDCIFRITCRQAERSPGDSGSQLIISSVWRNSSSSSGQWHICS